MSEVPIARPEPAAPRAYAFPELERATLTNGLRVAVAHMPRLPLVTILVLTDCGAATDRAGAEGLAMLTARALGEGSAGSDGRPLGEAFEALGSGFDSECDWDATMAEVTVTSERAAAAAALLASAIMRPQFAERDVARLRDERIDALLQLAKEPRGLADVMFTETAYHPEARYGRPDGGTRHTVQVMGAADLRAYHEKHFAPDASTVILAGDVKPDAAFTIAERALGSWTGAAESAQAVDDRPSTALERIVVVDKPGASQSELRIGHRGTSRGHRDYFALVVMNALLGGLFSSRINLNLRERNGYTYGAKSAFDWRRGAGPFMVSTAVKTDTTARAVREVLVEIDRMRTELVPADELALATAYLDGVFPIRFETTEAVADAIARATTHALGDAYYSTYRERVRAVTADDVRRVAQEQLRPEELRIAVIGDASEITGELEALLMGPVRRHRPDDET